MTSFGAGASRYGGVDLPAISVVIATIGRDTLRQAVESALSQTHLPTEVLIVYDLSEVPELVAFPAQSVRLLCTGGNHGPNAARTVGVTAATGDAIAFLDDDDYWYPPKLATQALLFAHLRAQGLRPIISAGVDAVTPDGEILTTGPKHVIQPGQPLADYLFVRREIRQSAAMGPSQLLIETGLLREVPLAGDLRLHEDWDWLLRVAQRSDVAFDTAPQPLLAYRIQPRGRLTPDSQQWLASQAWADKNRKTMSRRAYGDFLLTISAAIAVASGARRAALMIAVRGLLRGRPGLPAILFITGLLLTPRDVPSRLLSTLSRVKGIGQG